MSLQHNCTYFEVSSGSSFSLLSGLVCVAGVFLTPYLVVVDRFNFLCLWGFPALVCLRFIFFDRFVCLEPVELKDSSPELK